MPSAYSALPVEIDPRIQRYSRLAQRWRICESRPRRRCRRTTKPGPTFPGLNDAPFSRTPLFVPCTSSAVLSPDHQLTRPAGGEHACAGTLRREYIPRNLYRMRSWHQCPFRYILCCRWKILLPSSRAVPPKSAFCVQALVEGSYSQKSFILPIRIIAGSDIPFTADGKSDCSLSCCSPEVGFLCPCIGGQDHIPRNHCQATLSLSIPVPIYPLLPMENPVRIVSCGLRRSRLSVSRHRWKDHIPRNLYRAQMPSSCLYRYILCCRWKIRLHYILLFPRSRLSVSRYWWQDHIPRSPFKERSRHRSPFRYTLCCR